jgi:hypothetical protein
MHYHAGIDVSLETANICIVDDAGTIIASLKLKPRPKQVTIVGAVPLPSIDGDEVKKAAFRIAGEINIEAVKSRPRPAKPGDGRFRKWNPKYASASPAVSPALRPALVIGAEAALTL